MKLTGDKFDPLFAPYPLGGPRNAFEAPQHTC